MATKEIRKIIREVLDTTEVEHLVTKQQVDQLEEELVRALHRNGFIDALVE